MTAGSAARGPRRCPVGSLQHPAPVTKCPRPKTSTSNPVHGLFFPTLFLPKPRAKAEGSRWCFLALFSLLSSCSLLG